jgi:hypothetical protein
LREAKTVDFAVVDQVTGPTAPCDWLEFAKRDDGYVVAWLTGIQPTVVAVPTGWTIERSLSRNFRFVPHSDIRNQMKWLTRENNVDVLVDRDQRPYGQALVCS